MTMLTVIGEGLVDVVQRSSGIEAHVGGLAPARETVTAAAFAPSVSACRIASSDKAEMPALVIRPCS